MFVKGVNFPEKFGKTLWPVWSVFVGVYVLPEEGYFDRSVLNVCFAFFVDVLDWSADFSSSGVGNNAVRAELITSLHYWDEYLGFVFDFWVYVKVVFESSCSKGFSVFRKIMIWKMKFKNFWESSGVFDSKYEINPVIFEKFIF